MNNNDKKFLQSILIFVGISLLTVFMMFSMFQIKPGKNHAYSEIIAHFKNKEVESYAMNVGSKEMEIKLKNGEKIKYIAPSVIWIREDIKDYIKAYNEENPGALMKEEITPPQEVHWFLAFLPNLLFGILFLVATFMIMKRISGGIMGGDNSPMNFMKARVKNAFEQKNKNTFADVAGSEEEKEELKEIVEFLKFPRKYNEMGASIPKGVLLVGPPGTGKTLLARAVAGEASVPFFLISGSEFVEMYVGLGASRVRNLFAQAKKNSPCIIFIDEIDSVGSRRGNGSDKGSDEREQTLNQLLVELDGFGINEGIIVIAATNRGDVLDKALLRPGRFDRQIMVGLPDIRDREIILKVHSKGKPLAPDVNLKTIAKSTAGFTGADLSNVLNEAALLTVREGFYSITMEIIEKATMKVVMGTEKKSRVINDKDKRITAYHEAGHAITNFFCSNHDPVHEISIIPRGMAAGYTLSLPEEDRAHLSKKEMEEKIIVLFGGRIAESLIIGDVTTGASNDISRATEIARDMVTKYGMSNKIGPIAYEDYQNDSKKLFFGEKNYSEKIASEIDTEVQKIVSTFYEKSRKILKENVEKLHKISSYLIENEKMDAIKFKEIMVKN